MSALVVRYHALMHTFARVAVAIAAVALMLMAAVEAWQVIARYVLNDSPGWTEPLALLALNTAMSLGAASNVQRGAHVGFFIAVEASPPRVRRALRLFTTAVMAVVGAMLCVWGAVLLRADWDVAMPGLGLPQGLVFAPITVAGALVVVFALDRALALFGPEALTES